MATIRFEPLDGYTFDGLSHKVLIIEKYPKTEPSLLEKIHLNLFFMVFGYLDVSSVVNLQRGNRKLLYLCGTVLKNFLGKLETVNHSHLLYISALRPHRFCWVLKKKSPIEFDHFFNFTFNVTHLNLEGVPSMQIGHVILGLHGCQYDIKSLTISNSKLCSGYMIDMILPHCPSGLTFLDLSGTDTSVSGDLFVEEIGNRFSYLEHLNLNLPAGTASIGKKSIGNKEIMSLLTKCENLKTLKISGLRVNDDGAVYFDKAKNLTELDISGTKITQRGVQIIAQVCQELMFLNISSINIDDEVFETIGNYCKHLKIIHLHSSSDVGLTMLARCSELQEIYTNSYHSIIEQGVECLIHRCKNLQKISTKEGLLNIRKNS